MNIWIETDLEPDDILALAILPKAKYYVVGEGSSNIKYNRMLNYCQLLGNKEAIVIEGQSSDKPFHADGKEFEQLSSQKCNIDYLENFTNFANTENPVMFSLKPARELLEQYTKNPELIRKLVSRVTLFVYGGFNFRSVLRQYSRELLQLLNSFKEVNIYESFQATGQQNSVNKTNFPNLHKYIMSRSQEPFYQALLSLTYIWNKHICSDLGTSIRRLKIIDDIKGHEEFQYVLADFGLASIYREIKPIPVSNLRFDDNGYIKFDDAVASNIRVYKNIPLEVIEKLVLKYI